MVYLSGIAERLCPLLPQVYPRCRTIVSRGKSDKKKVNQNSKSYNV